MHKRIRSFVIFMAGALLGAIIYGSARRILPSPSAQTTAQRWEYRVVTSSKNTGLLGGTKGDVDNELNQLGTQGFEICEMTQSSSSTGYYLTIVLRRPKP
jgi:hypothetical protein